MLDDLAKQILKDVNLDAVAPRPQNNSPVGHWTSAVLLERGAYLKKMARYGNGAASEAIREYPQHQVMLASRSRSGEAELYENFAHLIVVLGGLGTLVTGKSVTKPRKGQPGETRGDLIEGGSRQELRQGDVIHVPPGIAHQIVVAGDKTITYLTVRIQEPK